MCSVFVLLPTTITEQYRMQIYQLYVLIQEIAFEIIASISQLFWER